jgi:hypothetical protein
MLHSARCLLMICISLFAATGTAKAQDDWGRVAALPAGTKVRVTKMDGSVQKSLVEAATAGALRLQSGELAKTDVRRITNLSKNHRLRNALIGAGIGVVGGVILDKTAGERFRNEGRELNGALYGASIGIGAAIGALIPSHPVIYRSR